MRYFFRGFQAIQTPITVRTCHIFMIKWHRIQLRAIDSTATYVRKNQHLTATTRFSSWYSCTKKNAHSRKNEIKNFRATKNSQKEFPLFSGLHIFGAIFCSFGASWQHLCFIITYFVHHMIRALLCITVCISILHLFLSCYSALIPSEIGKKQICIKTWQLQRYIILEAINADIELIMGIVCVRAHTKNWHDKLKRYEI